MTLLPLVARGQGLPYSEVMTLQEVADELTKIEGIECELRDERDEDRRPFKVFLESPEGKTDIQVSEKGVFRLPTLPKESWDRSQVLHTLEKGALKLSFHFGFRGQTSEGATLSEMCKGMAAGFQKIEGFKTRLARVMPEFADLQVAVVGSFVP